MIGQLNTLSLREQEAYMKIRQAVYDMRETVDVPLKDGDELLEVYHALTYDFPEIKIMWNYIGSRYALNRNGMKLYMKYKGSQQQIRNKMNSIDQEVDRILLKCAHESDEKCIEEIHKYLVQNMNYSKKLSSGKYPEYSYNLECLLHKEGVCCGMSEVYSYILDKLQIPSMVVVGDTSNGLEKGTHAWNIHQVSDGSYRLYDVTWDACRKGNTYYGLDDISMGTRKHYWDKEKYPKCS